MLLLKIGVASHGYSLEGRQAVLAPFYDPITNQLEIIEIEKIIRDKVTKCTNVFCWVTFACCREIKPIQNFDLLDCLNPQNKEKMELEQKGEEENK